MKRVLIIGASGLVGGYLYRTSPSDYVTKGTFQKYPIENLTYLDITDKESVKKDIYDFEPDFIFLPAALTNVDFCEANKDLCWKINVEGTNNVVSAIKDNKTKLIYFSTDFIFNGYAGPYSEEDLPDPINNYGKSKLEAEKIIQEKLSNFLIIRTTCVYGMELQQKNFVLNLIKKINLNETINVAVDQITTPTYARDLTLVAWELVTKDRKGIYNVVGSNLLSRFDFALLVADIFGLDKNLIKGVKTEELIIKAKRPLKGGLKIDKIKNELSINMPTVEKSLLLFKEEIVYANFR